MSCRCRYDYWNDFVFCCFHKAQHDSFIQQILNAKTLKEKEAILKEVTKFLSSISPYDEEYQRQEDFKRFINK
jgi:hypothetical protein